MADLGTTKMLLDRGGVEMNPIVAPIADNMLAFGAVKAIPLIMLGKQLKNMDKKKTTKVLKALNLFMGGLVANNLYQLSKTR